MKGHNDFLEYEDVVFSKYGDIDFLKYGQSEILKYGQRDILKYGDGDILKIWCFVSQIGRGTLSFLEHILLYFSYYFYILMLYR